ncbi:MAG: PilZ domain-containing protein [Desulfotalea sp.]
MDNKRIATRTDYKTKILIVSLEGELIGSGQMIDISVFGMRLNTECEIDVNREYQFSIIIKSPHSQLAIENLKGQIKNLSDNEFGVEFSEKFDWFALFNVYSCYGKGIE